MRSHSATILIDFGIVARADASVVKPAAEKKHKAIRRPKVRMAMLLENPRRIRAQGGFHFDPRSEFALFDLNQTFHYEAVYSYDCALRGEQKDARPSVNAFSIIRHGD